MPSEASWFSLAILYLGTRRPRQGSHCLETPKELEAELLGVLFKEITLLIG